MKHILGLGMLILIGVMGWQLGERLSADAISMALGVLFGIMAGIPAALMVLAARREDPVYRPHRRHRFADDPYYQIPDETPVITYTARASRPTRQIVNDSSHKISQGMATTLTHTANSIEDVLTLNGLHCDIVKILISQLSISYQLRSRVGVRVSEIAALGEKIALELVVSEVRIYRIGNKVSIDIPLPTAMRGDSYRVERHQLEGAF